MVRACGAKIERIKESCFNNVYRNIAVTMKKFKLTNFLYFQDQTYRLRYYFFTPTFTSFKLNVIDYEHILFRLHFIFYAFEHKVKKRQ